MATPQAQNVHKLLQKRISR